MALAPFIHATASAGASTPAEGWNLLNMPQGVTSVSREIYDIHMIVIWICVVIGVLVFGVMFYSMFAHRKSRGHKPATFHESTTVELVWTIIPAIILVVMAFPATRTLKELYDTSEADLDIKITGYQWKWRYDYLGTEVGFMSELATTQASVYGQAPKTQYYLEEVTEPVVIPAGKKVRFLITGADVIHSWWVPDLGVKRDAIPGFVNETWALAKQPGIYRGRCAELCGKDHAFMPIVVDVRTEADYLKWVDEQKKAMLAKADDPTKEWQLADLTARGEKVFAANCAACHQANGKGVPGTFPALDGSKVVLGKPEGQVDVVLHGRPGTAMAPFKQLSDVELAAVITYTRNAWGNKAEQNVVQPSVVTAARK